MKDRSFSTALHIMVSLAYQDGRRVCSEELAQGAKTNPGLIRRILSRLSKAGLVDCMKGKNGGSSLSRGPKKISLSEVYEAVADSPMFATFEKEPFEKCPVSCQIGEILTEVFEEIEKPMMQKMKSLKLSDLLKKVR